VSYVKDSFSRYTSAQNEYLHRLNAGGQEFNMQQIYEAEEAMNIAYKDYIHTLELELERQGGIEGELVEP
jgi:hypothetical protein